MRALSMRHILLPLLLLFSNPLLAQELVEFENGQVADADELNQSLNFLLDKIVALEARVLALEPLDVANYSLDLDEDGNPNDCTYPLDYLLATFERTDRSVQIIDDYIETGTASVSFARYWSFDLPSSMTIASKESIDFFLDIEEVRPNVSSDLPFGITDGQSLLYYINNGLGNGSASPLLVTSYSEASDGAVYENDYEYRAVVNFSGLSDYRLAFSLTDSGSTLTVTDYGDGGRTETTEVPYQNLDLNTPLKIVIHGQEANESYKIRSFGISFPESDSPVCP
jgi:hypothetical protein